MRLIDADALYERTAEWEAQASAHIEWLIREPIEEMTEHDKSEWKRWTAIMGERTAFKHDVADAPTIEAEPVKHGQWVWDNRLGEYYCSACQRIMKPYVVETADSEYRLIQPNYCGWCGAMMDEVEE